MKVLYSWLKEFVDFEESPQQLAEILTFLGVETRVLAPAPVWSGIITAQVLEVAKHPNADKLSLCTLTDGKDQFSVVCGAQNVKAGQTVPLALPGAKLPGGLEIKKAKIRGVESSGMICSERELGLSAESSGIMVLSPDSPLGKNLEEVIGKPDTVLEVEITTNRPDCLSHLGVAREIAARMRKPLRPPEVKRPGTKSGFKITIEDAELCPRYIGCVMEGVKIGPAPGWIARRLEQCGIRPINNIVDITNYVLLELGHPLHAFDRACLTGGEIVVRTARAGEKILALDGREYALKEDMLVIADTGKPEAIAGIMGGEGSGVTENTKDIVLESAIFKSSSIRRTSKALGVASEASYRFERGTSWDVSELASWRAANLLQEIAGGRLAARTDEVKKAHIPVKIVLRPERVNHLLGMEIQPEEMRDILTALGMQVSVRGAVFEVEVPSCRLDVNLEVDLIEELVRLKGYEHVPVRVMPFVPDITGGRRETPVEELLRERLAAIGFCEAMNYGFTQEEDLSRFALPVAHRIVNPLSRENEVLRSSLLPGLWKSFGLNLAQGFDEIKLFETGTIFTPVGERRSAALLAFGHVWSEWWGWEKRGLDRPSFDFYFLAGVVERILSDIPHSVKAAANPPSFLHPGKSAVIEIAGVSVGTFGILRPDLNPDVTREAGYAEFDVQTIEEHWKRETPVYAQLRRQPPAKRDLSLLADGNVSFSQVRAALDEFSRPDSFLEKSELFSVFEDARKLGPDKKSFSLHLVFRHPELTLTDARVNEQMEKLIRHLGDKLGLTLR